MSLHAKALTVENIRRAVQGLDLITLYCLLWIPFSKQGEISRGCQTDSEREAAVIRYWLTMDPLASYRRLINQLYEYGELDRADRIRHYAEELTGMYTTWCVYMYIYVRVHVYNH